MLLTRLKLNLNDRAVQLRRPLTPPALRLPELQPGWDPVARAADLRWESRGFPRVSRIRMLACSRKLARHAWHDPCLTDLDLGEISP